MPQSHLRVGNCDDDSDGRDNDSDYDTESSGVDEADYDDNGHDDAVISAVLPNNDSPLMLPEPPIFLPEEDVFERPVQQHPVSMIHLTTTYTSTYRYF